jgi:alpha-N-acetylglucosaminidase
VALLALAAVSMSNDAANEVASNQHHLDGVVYCETKPAEQVDAAKGLLQRLLPEYQHLFNLRIAPPDTTSSFFEIEVIDGIIDVYGTSGIELTSAINWFLKYFCNSSVSWEATGGRQLDSSSFSAERMREYELRGKVRVDRVVPHSYYQNIVTMSYSFTYWDWDRW